MISTTQIALVIFELEVKELKVQYGISGFVELIWPLQQVSTCGSVRVA